MNRREQVSIYSIVIRGILRHCIVDCFYKANFESLEICLFFQTIN